jgi:hypothetical protein
MEAENNCRLLQDWMMPDPSPINYYDNAQLFQASCKMTAINIATYGEGHLSNKQ